MPKRLQILLVLLVITAAAGAWRLAVTPRAGPGAKEYAGALQAQRAGDLDGAIRRLRQALLLEPANGEYHAELGDLYLQVNEFAYAAASLQIAAHLAPERPHVHCLLGQALVEERRRDEALEALETGLKQMPDCPHALSVRGEQFLRDDNLKAALADFQRVIGLQPDFALAYQKAGYILSQTHQDADAEQVLKAGLERDPASPGMHLLLAELYLKRAHQPEAHLQAERHYHLSLPRNPEKAAVYAGLGRIYLRKDDLPAARDHFEKALASQRYQQDALYGLAQVARRQGRGAEADLHLKRYGQVQEVNRRLADLQAAATGRDDVEARLRVAQLCLEIGFHKEAARALDAAVSAAPGRRDARELRAQLYAALGRDVDAVREYRVAARLPKFTP